MIKALLISVAILAAASTAACQQGSGRPAFVSESARALALTPFNTSWWDGITVTTKEQLAIANARIYVQGCTLAISDQIGQVYWQSSQGDSPAGFVTPFRDICRVGPGLWGCLKNNNETAGSLATAIWASQNGGDLFPFNPDAANLGRVRGAPLPGPSFG